MILITLIKYIYKIVNIADECHTENSAQTPDIEAASPVCS